MNLPRFGRHLGSHYSAVGVDLETSQTRLITVDRRAAGMGIFGGDGRQFLTEAMNEMADGLAKFLKRLSAGGKPGAS